VNKFPPQFIEDKPKVTNPKLDINYSKVIYFGYLFLKQRGFFSKKIIHNSKIPMISYKDLPKMVLDVDKKIAERNAATDDQKIAYLFWSDSDGYLGGGDAGKVWL